MQEVRARATLVQHLRNSPKYRQRTSSRSLAAADAVGRSAAAMVRAAAVLLIHALQTALVLHSMQTGPIAAGLRLESLSIVLRDLRAFVQPVMGLVL